MEEFVKVCPNCGKENDVSMDYCSDCGEIIKLVIPTIKTSNNEAVNNNSNIEVPKIKYYKICRVCGSKNYLRDEFDFLDSCTTCGNEDINDVPTMKEEVVNNSNSNSSTKEEVKKDVYPKLVFSDNHSIEITKDEVLGRYGTIDIEYFQTNPYVSGEHCSIKKEDDEYYLIDLNSTNGTKINGTKVLPKMKNILKNGYQVVLANMSFTFVYED